MMGLLLIAGCLLGLLCVAGLLVGLVVLVQSSQQDVVSQARQGWIFRRSDKDEGGW